MGSPKCSIVIKLLEQNNCWGSQILILNEFERAASCASMCWKNIFLDSEKLFFRKARFQSTKGLLTQRNAIKTIFGNLKKCFCDRAGSFGHWFSGDRQKVCKFCPRFHGVKARKHILSNLIFAWRKMNSQQQQQQQQQHQQQPQHQQQEKKQEKRAAAPEAASTLSASSFSAPWGAHLWKYTYFPGLPCSRGPNPLAVRAWAYSLKIRFPYRARARFPLVHPVSRGSLTKVLCFQHAYSHGFRVAKGWCDRSFLPRAGRRITSQTAGWTV